MRVRSSILLWAGFAGALAACFEGQGLVGAICYADNQCGVGQTCVNSVCGVCNNRLVDPGELCFGASSEEIVYGEVSDLIAYDPENDNFAPLVIATVNNNCATDPMMKGPPPMNGNACWEVFALVFDDSGDFEVLSLVDEVGDGRIPQASTGNFDGEGTMDLAMAIFPNDPLIDQSQLVVFYDLAGTDEGGVTDILNISVRAKTLHAADLNGDGLEDLLVGGEVTASLTELIAQPTDEMPGGAFAIEQLKVIDDVAPRPAPPVDMDGDGDLDVVLVSPVDRRLSTYENDGNGNLAAIDRLDLGTHAPLDLAVADFDQDGNPDAAVFLVAEGIASEVRVYRGQSDGTFELEQTLPGGELPVSGIAADVNSDGWTDIVVADFLEDKLPVHINRNGSFVDLVNIDVASGPRTLMHVDYDLDSIPDLVVGNGNGVVAGVPSEN